MKENNKGITLVALTITIIIIIILSSIAVSMIDGNNGVIKETIESKQIAESESIKEKIEIAYMASKIVGTNKIDYEILNRKLNEIGYNGKYISQVPIAIEINENNYIVGNIEPDDSINIALVDNSKPLSTLKGDANLDGIISTRDCMLILQYAAGYQTVITQQGIENSDTDEDGKTNAGDSIVILRISYGLDVITGVNTFSVGDEITLKAYKNNTSYEGDTLENIAWTSSNGTIATVSSKGKVKFKKAGKVKIKAYSSAVDLEDTLVLYVE